MKKRIIRIASFLAIGSLALFLLAGCSGGDDKEVRVEYSPGAVFTTNVKDSDRLLKTAPVLVLDKEGLEEMLDLNIISIRDTIIFVLRELNEDSIRKSGRHEDLRERLAAELNEVLEIENIVDVRFSDFVMG